MTQSLIFVFVTCTWAKNVLDTTHAHSREVNAPRRNAGRRSCETIIETEKPVKVFVKLINTNFHNDSVCGSSSASRGGMKVQSHFDCSRCAAKMRTLKKTGCEMQIGFDWTQWSAFRFHKRCRVSKLVRRPSAFQKRDYSMEWVKSLRCPNPELHKDYANLYRIYWPSCAKQCVSSWNTRARTCFYNTQIIPSQVQQVPTRQSARWQAGTLSPVASQDMDNKEKDYTCLLQWQHWVVCICCEQKKQQRKLLLTRIFPHSVSMPILQQKDTIGRHNWHKKSSSTVKS